MKDVRQNEIGNMMRQDTLEIKTHIEDDLRVWVIRDGRFRFIRWNDQTESERREAYIASFNPSTYGIY